MSNTTTTPPINKSSETPIATVNVVATKRPTNPPVVQQTYNPKQVQLIQQRQQQTQTSDWYKSWFTRTNIVLFFCFVLLYFVIFGLMKLFLGESFSYATASLVVDCFAVIMLAIIIVGYYTTNSTSVTTADPLGNFMIWMRNFFDAPSNLLLLILLMIFMYLLLFVLQVPMGQFKPYSIRILETIVWLFLIVDIFAVIFMFLFGFSLTDMILNPMIDGWYSLATGSVAASPVVVGTGGNAETGIGTGGTGGTGTITGTITGTGGTGTGTITGTGTGGTGGTGGLGTLDTTVAVPINQCIVPTTAPPSCTDKTIPYIVRDASGNIMNNMRDLRSEICVNVSKQTPIPTTPVPKNQEVFNISNNLYSYEDARNVCSSYGARLATYDEVEAAYVDGGEWCNYGWSDNQMALFPTQKDTWSKLQMSKDHKNDCGRPGINGGYIENPTFEFGANCYGTKPTTGPQVSIANGPSIDFDRNGQNAGKMGTPPPIVVNNFNRTKWSEYQR